MFRCERKFMDDQYQIVKLVILDMNRFEDEPFTIPNQELV